MNTERNRSAHKCSEEAGKLRRFLSQKDLKRSFELKVLSYAAGLECCDADLPEKLNTVLEELKSCGEIDSYSSQGSAYWIRR